MATPASSHRHHSISTIDVLVQDGEARRPRTMEVLVAHRRRLTVVMDARDAHDVLAGAHKNTGPPSSECRPRMYVTGRMQAILFKQPRAGGERCEQERTTTPCRRSSRAAVINVVRIHRGRASKIQRSTYLHAVDPVASGRRGITHALALGNTDKRASPGEPSSRGGAGERDSKLLRRRAQCTMRLRHWSGCAPAKLRRKKPPPRKAVLYAL
ncbi:hypothetical protein C8Q80DRAFT_512705 [Daedaleopsis nitida]|nr:hypothetical protein C8Q80DRAFT_512705 [Daedaleopsis nitida]